MQIEQKIFYFSKPISFRLQKEREFQDIVITSIEFGDIDVGTVKSCIYKIKEYVSQAKTKTEQSQMEMLVRSLGKNYTELFDKSRRESYKEEAKEAEKIKITPADLIEMLNKSGIFQSFDAELDKVLVKTSLLQTEDGIGQPTTQEFLSKLGAFTKEKLILSFLDFFSELYE